MKYTWLMVEKNEIERYMKVWKNLLIVWKTTEVVDKVLLWRIPFNTVWELKTVDEDTIDEIMWIRESWKYDTWFFPHVYIWVKGWKLEEVLIDNILIEN